MDFSELDNKLKQKKINLATKSKQLQKILVTLGAIPVEFSGEKRDYMKAKVKKVEENSKNKKQLGNL